MKKNLIPALLMMMVLLPVSGQEKKIKTGWKLDGVLPAVTYDSDLGFQYGALAEVSNYGDGSRYPEYLDHFYMEASRYTKGSGIYRIMYESFRLVPGIHLVSDISYLPDQANHFYGFNGYKSVYNSKWMDEDETAVYRSRMFYRFERNLFRFKTDLKGKLAGEHLKWSAGFAFQNFMLGSVDIEKLNKNRKVPLPSLAAEPGLFEIYRDSLGLINANEANGGWVNTLRCGLEYDSRDNRKNPMKGTWTEAGIEVSPGFAGNDWSFSRLYITHRQYFTLKKEKLALAYRLNYQTTLSGTLPFFYQSQVITSFLTGATNEGLGGVSTLRGVRRNRVIGDGFFYGNVELRWKPLNFKLLNQDVYIGLNAFYDFGMITREISLPANLQDIFSNALSAENYSDFFSAGKDKLHQCAGISIMPVLNRNFVIAVDIGKAFNSQDGNIGFAVGLNYLF
jgi:outer membrane protein assembly factor BamA